MIRGKYGAATARDVAEWFGLHGTSQFCDMGHAPKVIDGHTVWVEPKTPGRMRIRTMTRCLTCGKTVPVGRLAQHERTHGPQVRWVLYHDVHGYLARSGKGWKFVIAQTDAATFRARRTALRAKADAGWPETYGRMTVLEIYR